MLEFDRVLRYLPTILSSCLSKMPQPLKNSVVELRLRLNKPIMVVTVLDMSYITLEGTITQCINNALIIDDALMRETILSITGRALHSKQTELANGYITMPGGNRVGVAGTAIIENDKIVGIKNISSLNIRIAKNTKLPDIESLRKIINNEMFSLLIIGAPRTGKTTLLKSIASQLSCDGRQVTVIDTRCEIAPNVGDFHSGCDILSAFPRAEGIINAVKSLAPDVIICDEIGSIADATAVEAAINSGVNLVVTAHASNLIGARKRPGLSRLFEMEAFSDIAILQGSKTPGIIKEVLNGVDN